jgi:hypothetical protein
MTLGTVKKPGHEALQAIKSAWAIRLSHNEAKGQEAGTRANTCPDEQRNFATFELVVLEFRVITPQTPEVC